MDDPCKLFNILIVTTLIAIIAIIIYIFYKIVKEENDKIHTLESYNKNLSVMYDNIRGFKHDFSNFVQALDGYVKTNNIEGIKSMSEGIIKDCTSIKNLEALDPNIINNSAIYNIITNKYYLAQEQDIIMNIEVMINVEDIKLNNYEFCKILAILLDNAIEAASKCEDKKLINLKLMNDANVNRKLVIVENSYTNTEIDIDKIFEKGYTSKDDENQEAHGLGLWTIRKILNQKENLNLFTQKGELFVQQLEIYE